MLQTVNESINEGRTKQDFIAGARYDVPLAVGQLWIGRGWARSATAAPKAADRNGNGR